MRVDCPGKGLCAEGERCRTRPLIQPVGKILITDGICPDGMSPGECASAPGKLCCAETIAAIDWMNAECVALPAACMDCSCAPADVCGATIQTCEEVGRDFVRCKLAQDARS